MLIAPAPIIAGALIAAGAGYYWRLGRELRAHGVTAQATVTAMRPATGPLGDYSECTLEFADTAGNPRTATVKERKMRSGMIREGMKVRISYHPANPGIVELGYLWGKKIEGWVAVVFGMFGVGMVLYGLGLIAGVR